MDIPISMQAELGEWNNGAGIDLESWIGCEGRFALAIGYLTILWPEWELIDGYILRKGTPAESIRGFESQAGSTRQLVEAVLNHVHLADIQYRGCPDCSSDKLVVLGSTLKQIYEAKLQWQFPDRPCVVSLFVPEDPGAVDEYQITFWQVAHQSPA
jgi:hypothetical protein